jgi:hypothetical protein
MVHKLGFYHCDVGPQNIIILKDLRTSVLIDWGVAIRKGSSSSGFTPMYASLRILYGIKYTQKAL